MIVGANADSIKIHTKLNYYYNYKLENTNHIIEGIKLQKYLSGDNFLHSHNATIWNREYLIKNILENGFNKQIYLQGDSSVFNKQIEIR